MINSFLFNTGSESTGSLIQVIESGSVGTDGFYTLNLSNLQTDDLILILGSAQQVNRPFVPIAFATPPFREQPDFGEFSGFQPGLFEKPIDDFNTKATSFINYRIISEGETSYQVQLTGGQNDLVTRSVVYNYFVLRGVNPKDPYSLIVSSSDDDIGNINIQDSQAIIYSLYYQSSSFWNEYTENQNPSTSSLNPSVDLNGSQAPSEFSSSIVATTQNIGSFAAGFGVGEGKTQVLVHSAFKKFDEATTFDPDAFSFSNGHAGGKSTTAIVFNNTLDNDPPIKTHIVPTSSFTLNTTTGTGSWNPPPNGNNAFYDNFGIKNLNFYYKYAFPDNFTSIADTTGSGYEEPILAGTSNLVSFLENGFTKNFDSQGYYTGYYTAVDKFGNESVPADQADAFQLSEGFVAPVPEILSFQSVGFGTTSFNTDQVQEDDLILAFAYQGDGNTNNDNTSNLTLTDTATGDSFSSITLSGQDASPNINRFRAFFKFVSGSSLNGSNQMGITIGGSGTRPDSVLQTVAIRGVTTDTPFHNFVRRSGTANFPATNNNIINFPAASAIEQESKNMLILSVAGVRENTGNIGNPQPVIQDSVNSSLQLLTNPPERSRNDRSVIITAGYGQENPSDANVNSIAYGNNAISSAGRSATLVLFINPIGFEFSPTQQTPAALTTPPQIDFNIETTTVQLVGPS